MPAHYKDKTRDLSQPKPEGKIYKLFGIDDTGQIHFYWSEKRAEYAGYVGQNSKPDVWGTLTCKSPMRSDRHVFIENIKMTRKLEHAGIMRPCGHCNRAEYRIWKASQTRKKFAS